MATCVRRAWLTLADGSSIGLEGRGYVCTKLDLGYPTPREVTNNRPSHDGIYDRTRYMGGRVVQADLVALAGGGAVIDDVASRFAPYMLPSARPTLHYVLDRPGAAERTLVLRGSGYAWPIAGPSVRNISLQWLAADPIARDPARHRETAWTGAAVGSGRVYDLAYDRSYPLGGGTDLPTPAEVRGQGDVPIEPYLRMYGPVTAPVIDFDAAGAGGAAWAGSLGFDRFYRIDAGHFVGIDTAAHTAYLDDDLTQSVLASLDWSLLTWPQWPNLPTIVAVNYRGENTDHVTQCQIEWQDGYLS